VSANSLDTYIHLPPGPLSSNVLRQLLRLVFDEFRWFAPARYGYASTAEKIPQASPTIEPLVAYYEEHKTLCISSRTEKDFIWVRPPKPGSPFHHGKIIWATSAKSALKGHWRLSHAQQVAQVMQLVQSPLAWCALKNDLERKNQRLVPEGIGLRLTFNLRDYSEGLAGLFWRNFYGPPFVRMFGERLGALPAECHKVLGEDLVLVQPYELPTEAGTETGTARERELISLLGPECFYDHEHHTLPTRRPVLDSLGQPLH
jgi:hypothetical protein